MKNSPSKITNLKTPPAWQLERAARLQRICSSIEGRIERGHKLRKAIGWFGWYHQNRTFRCEPTRRFRICKGTLIRLFYQWRHSGKTVEAFRLKYRSNRPKLTRTAQIKFLRSCLRPGVHSYQAAHALTKDAPATVDAYYHALPRQCRQMLTRLFFIRRHVHWEERRAWRVLKGFTS